ncbi:hypothetical protein ACFVTE_07710 [Arthrobacter sp. NPDC058097]|uniref:hypothetical protein n=1 Tax=Arthrobacter sp. NPDC058097 TaxID=3346340 RepID=UPI0036D9059A
MSIPQAPESGEQPPNGQTNPGPGAQGPGMQGFGYQSRDGYGMAVASLVCGALILPSAFYTSGLAMLAMLFTRPDRGSNGKEWVANAVFYSLPALFAVLALVFGRVALKRSVRGSSVRRISLAGLIVAGVAAVILVLPLFIGEFDAFS